MPEFRIIYVENGSPCHWQVQQRTWLVFWKNIYSTFSSATTAANEIVWLMNN